MAKVFHEISAETRDDEASALVYARAVDIAGMTSDDVTAMYRVDGTISEIRFENTSRHVPASNVDYSNPDDTSNQLQITAEYYEYHTLYLSHVTSSTFDKDWFENSFIPALGNDHGLQFFIS